MNLERQLHRRSQNKTLKSWLMRFCNLMKTSNRIFQSALTLPWVASWEMLLMDLSNNQIGGINLEAIKDENWFRFDEWIGDGRSTISQDIVLMAAKQRNSRKFS